MSEVVAWIAIEMAAKHGNAVCVSSVLAQYWSCDGWIILADP
jgi:hypothetical protein